MKGKLIVLVLLVVGVVVSGCGSLVMPWDPKPTPTKTATPVVVHETAVPLPTYTPYPTYTVVPLAATPVPATNSVTATTALTPTVPLTTTAPLTTTVAVTGTNPALPANVPSVASAVPQTGSCPQAATLGPWAPDASGEGETFEVTAARGPVHLTAWWPNGKTPWGQAEVSVVVTPGVSINVIDGGGRAWDYAAECSQAEVDKQVADYRAGRGDWTVFYGPVTLQQLLDLKLVEIRVKRTSAAVVVPTQVASTSAVKPTQAPPPVSQTPSTTVATCTIPSAVTYSKPGDFSVPGMGIGSLWWQGHDDFDNGKEVRVFVPAGTTLNLLGAGGSWWKYASTCSEAAIIKEMQDSANKAGFRVVTIDELKTAGLAK